MSYWTKENYIKSRTEYWKEQGLNRKLATECAKEDWDRYCERYGYDEKTAQ